MLEMIFSTLIKTLRLDLSSLLTDIRMMQFGTGNSIIDSTGDGTLSERCSRCTASTYRSWVKNLIRASRPKLVDSLP